MGLPRGAGLRPAPFDPGLPDPMACAPSLRAAAPTLDHGRLGPCERPLRVTITGARRRGSDVAERRTVAGQTGGGRASRHAPCLFFLIAMVWGLTATLRSGRVLRLTDRLLRPKGLSRHILAPAGLRYSTVPLCLHSRPVLLVLARPTRRLTKKSDPAPIRDRCLS